MTNKSATSQDLPMRFWGLLGPFLTLLILAIYLFKVPHASPFMPLLAGAGLVLCSGWRIKGLAGALLLTALFLTWSYPQVPLQEKFWFVGISIAFGLAFVVTTLSLEEVDASILKLSSDATKGWSQLKNLDQKREQEQTLWLKNRE
ncbi:MAG: hypothetical protein KDK48_02555, partial [Chlamydiia bacterium]|nr:hypothetical protein [Chlamydiia bacterium]